MTDKEDKMVRHERAEGDGAVLSDSQIMSLPDGKKTLVKGLNGKKAATTHT
ncbi:hypothetical protein AALB53_09260 [Lachnospiraceae bacterium 47-T17]